MFVQLAPLTEDEKTVAKKWSVDSGDFHAVVQGKREAPPDWQSSSACLDGACTKFKLTAPTTLFGGIGDGRSILGSLRGSKPGNFVGLIYQYPGWFSASSISEVECAKFMCSGLTYSYYRPVFLKLRLPADFHVLAVEALGPGYSDEREFAIPKNQGFTIVDSEFGAAQDFCSRPPDPAATVTILMIEPR
jgi:hypothetical protein